MQIVSSHSVKILWSSNEEFWMKFNLLHADAGFPITISSDAMPDETTTKQCSEVFYYR